ncbi:amidase domain-containing protein [Ditylenchus destructor]|uniref:Amidase domain-containing protein n=1 Tax=Ditylenchus destructor TaxID=166010 RepID=A0AAD4NDW3_9BILA|nr:amidase domain-containing protein [Ditylenchus destructor]
MNCPCDELSRTPRNPYDLRRSTGGSSSGEGAIIASGASPFGIGNDLGGSVRLPAAMCGIYGLKPSPGLLTLKGIIPETMDALPWVQELGVSGPMCRYAEDISLIMEVLVEEKSDKYALNWDRPYDFHTTKIYCMEPLNHILIEPMHPRPKAAVKKAAQYFEQAFASQTAVVHFPLADNILEIFSALIVDEGFKCPTYFQCIQEVIKFIFCDSDATTIGLELSFIQAAVLNGPSKIEKLRNDCNKLRNEIIDLLGDNGLLLCATIPMPPRFHGQLEFVQFNFAYTCLFTALRLPSLVCPLGLDEQDSMPVSIQLVGKPNSDGFLIEAAKELEKGGCGGWVAPWKVSP